MRVGRLFGSAGIAIAGASGALVIFAHNDSVQQWGHRYLQSIAKAAGIEFSAQHLFVDPCKLRATLNGVVFNENGTGLRAARVSTDLPWNVFTSAVKEITNVEIDDLDIRVKWKSSTPKVIFWM